MRQFFLADARRQICDARDRRHAQAALPRDNRLRHRAHPDRVRTEGGERADLRRCLITRPAHCKIDTSAQFLFGNFSSLEQECPQILVVSFCQINEAQQTRNRRAAQWICAHEIDVVGQHHEIAGEEFFIDAARRICQQQIRDAKYRQCPHRERNAIHRVAFVIMGATAQDQHRRPAQMAKI